MGAINVLGLAKRVKAKVLQASTSEVYGVSDDPIWTEESKSLIGPPTKLRWSYAASKLIDEFLALSEFNDGKLNPIIVRLFNIIGNNQLSKFGMVVPKFIEAALENKPLIIHGDGTQTRSFTWVGDVVNYFYLLAEKQLYGEIFNIGTGKPKQIKLIIKKINKIINRGVPNYGKIKMRKDEIMKLYPNINKAKTKLNWRPKISFEKGLKKTINYYQKLSYGKKS